jgi:hypothetical protein
LGHGDSKCSILEAEYSSAAMVTNKSISGQALQLFQANQCHESSLCLLSTRMVLPWTLIGLSLADILYVDPPLTT